MQTHPVRLFPGDDLRGALEDTLRALDLEAAFVLQGIGSLSVAQLRFAGAEQATELRGDLEILTLAGSISPNGAHLHLAARVGDRHVQMRTVRTTAEILLALLPEHRFTREPDAATGYLELFVSIR
jgi:predicted DNA-binding protein with PD1-like motif